MPSLHAHFHPLATVKGVVRLLRAVHFHWRLAALALAAAVGIAAGLSGSGHTIDRLVRQLGWSLRDRAASGKLHVVEIDARSIAAVDRWPWPRRNYALIVDRLNAAGAASVTFDVDFSSSSDPVDDAAFGAALQRAGGKVALPTFSQASGGGGRGWTESLPIPVLRDHAALAAVSVLPDGDGYVRRMPLGITTAGIPRPSLSAMIAATNGAAGDDFPVDFGINPDTIPRHSFVDIRDGRFDPASVRGKDILIGATAVELGDRYAVPQYGVIPGVVIQALAVETLYNGVPREAGWQGPLVVALGLGMLILRARSRLQLAARLVAVTGLPVAVLLLMEGMLFWTFPLAPALLSLSVCGCAAVTMRALNSVRRRWRHDGQTGLPNRVALDEALQTRIEDGVFAAKIVEFEKIVAALGAGATATLIQRVSDRIAIVAGGGTVYRIEDRMLAWRCRDQSEVDLQVANLRALMLSPIDVAGRRVDVTLAIGFVEQADAGRADRIIESAVLAAANAATDGSGWHQHHAGDADVVDRELSLLGELDDAIARDEIRIVYQPKLDLRRNVIVSVEALVRWEHPVRGFMPPDAFIPLAERNDRIAGLTLHVLALTLADLRRWHASGLELTSAVNISAKLLNSDEFISELRRMVEESRIDPTWLTLEVTESAAMTYPERAASALRLFRDMGISISMDDYGTGQSSLSYLKQLPLSELKIDRSFVQFAHQNRSDGALVRSTVNLAHELGLKIVAEGVEDPGCLDFLVAIGCDMAQGYLISRPVPAAELEDLIRDRRAAA